MHVGIATDHGGFRLKEDLITRLRAAGHDVLDFGAAALNPDDDYPDFVIPLAQAVASETLERGIAIWAAAWAPASAPTKFPEATPH